MVCIDRNGNYQLIDGQHRFAIAKTLKLSKIPVIVAVRHELYINFPHSSSLKKPS